MNDGSEKTIAKKLGTKVQSTRKKIREEVSVLYQKKRSSRGSDMQSWLTKLIPTLCNVCRMRRVRLHGIFAPAAGKLQQAQRNVADSVAFITCPPAICPFDQFRCSRLSDFCHPMRSIISWGLSMERFRKRNIWAKINLMTKIAEEKI